MGAGIRIRCKRCGDVIQSMYTYDFKYCKCGSVAIDSGSDYLRVLHNGEYDQVVEELDNVIEINKNEDDSNEAPVSSLKISFRGNE